MDSLKINKKRQFVLQTQTRLRFINMDFELSVEVKYARMREHKKLLNGSQRTFFYWSLAKE